MDFLILRFFFKILFILNEFGITLKIIYPTIHVFLKFYGLYGSQVRRSVNFAWLKESEKGNGKILMT